MSASFLPEFAITQKKHRWQSLASAASQGLDWTRFLAFWRGCRWPRCPCPPL